MTAGNHDYKPERIDRRRLILNLLATPLFLFGDRALAVQDSEDKVWFGPVGITPGERALVNVYAIGNPIDIHPNKADEIAVVFCGSKKSLVTGVPMANILFPASLVGVVILPIMLFHQLQLLVCATLAQRYAERPETGEPQTSA